MAILDLVEDGKIKRIFRGRNKLVFPGAVVHITQRAPGKEFLFLEDADYLFMLHLLKEIAKRFSLEIFSFALMPNHLHLLLRLKEVNLAEAAKSLFERYAKFFNQKYERKGHVFGGNYREAVCFDDTYLLASSLYIHLNAVSAGIVDNPVNYRWSSCRLFVETIKGTSFVNPEFILSVLDKDINKARQIYRDLLEIGREMRLASVYEDPKVLNSFRLEIFQRKRNLFMENDELLNEEILDKKIRELRNKKRLRKPEDFKARRFLIEQLKARGYNMTEIASKLNISRVSLYRYLK